MLTEAGEKWLVEYITLHPRIPEYGDMVGAMKYGIHAFCDALEQRIQENIRLYGGDAESNLPRSYEDLKRELLSDNEPKL